MTESVSQVYVLDDDVSVREAVGGLIRSAGLCVKTFASAQETLASLRKELPSCLVLDIQLPDINGLELQRELVSKDIQMPIIFLTGHGDIPMSVRAIKAGALEFLTKPFDDEYLRLTNFISRFRYKARRNRQSLQRFRGAVHLPKHIPDSLILSSSLGQRSLRNVNRHSYSCIGRKRLSCFVKPEALSRDLVPR